MSVQSYNAAKVTENLYPKSEQSSQMSPNVSFHLPALIMETPHREAILNISASPDNSLLVVGQDGMVTHWSADLILKKSRIVLEENKQPARTPKWIADATFMPQFNKLVIGTCDREIRFYEMANFEPYFQITGLESMPLQIDYSHTGEDECLILYGDNQGCVNIIQIFRTAETLRNWSKYQVMDGIPSIPLENISDGGQVNYIRWKVHNDWVTKMKYFHSVKSVISSSNDENTSLVMGCVTGTKNITQRLKEMTDGSSVKSRNVPLGSAPPRRLGTDEAVFQAHKGVKAFDFSKEKNLLVTGGLDRILRLWNPYITGWPTGLLHGHNAPISFVHLSSDDDRIYSLSTDINIMVWSIESQACLASIISTASHIKGELSAFHFSHDLGALCIATDTLAVLRFRHKEAKCNSSTSHKLPIICCRYNAQSQHVISCSEDSVVKVWDFNTGALLFEFNAAHNTAAVSCMTLDSSGKRILTGGRDGCVRKWDCSTHQCIALFSPVKDSPEEVTCCIQAEIHSNKYIISAGCDRRINIYPDLQDNSKGVQSLASQWLHQEPSPHYEDIVCIALWPPNLLATSSCGGEVLIWNLISGKVFCRLGSLPQSPLHDASGEDQNVGKILFIPSRGASHKTAASLIASGPGGCIHFWNMFGGGRLFARFRTPSISTTITDLALGKDDSLLLASDQLGFVHVWDIAQFAQQNVETTAPPLLHSWKAHPVSITSVEFVPEQLLILTSSRDCLLRLWTCKGTLIGTFGVSNPWDVKEQSTWKQDLPTELKSGTEDHLPDMQPAYGLGSEVTGSYADFSDTDTNQQLLVSYSSDLNIAEEVQKYQSFPRVHRNQLKQITIPHVCGRMMTYHSLSCYELADVRRTIQKPNPAAELNDPYDFSF